MSFQGGQLQDPLAPCLDAISFDDPRQPSHELPVLAFYFPGREEPCDKLCRSGFLGNFYDLGYGAIALQTPGDDWTHHFRNSEAAFQALKFWTRAYEFEHIDGHEAFRKKKQLYDITDLTYGGFGSNWKAMRAVLEAKFKPGLPWTDALISTRDAFLLEHNSVSGRDAIWSDDKFGRGKNWLGLQLMLLRDELTQQNRWTTFLRCYLDIESGEPWDAGQAAKWQNIVKHASDATVSKVLEMEETSSYKWQGSPRGLHAAEPVPEQTGNTSLATSQSAVNGIAESSRHNSEEGPHEKRLCCRSADQDSKFNPTAADTATAENGGWASEYFIPFEMRGHDREVFVQGSSTARHGCTFRGVTRWENEPCAPLATYPRDVMVLPSGKRLPAADFAPAFQRSMAASRAVALWRGNIAEAPTDVLINPVEEGSFYGGGVAAAITSAAGYELSRAYVYEDPPRRQKPVVTNGFKLQAMHVLHVAAPQCRRNDSWLFECYWAALDCIVEGGLRSVAFPCIAAGAADAHYPYTLRDATHIALRTVRRWMDENEGKLDCVVFAMLGDEEHALYSKLLPRYFPRLGDLALSPLEPFPGNDISVALACTDEKCWCVKVVGLLNWNPNDHHSTMKRLRGGTFRKAWSFKKGEKRHFKFFVDGKWLCRSDLPIVKDTEGNVNNILDLTAFCPTSAM